LLLALNETPDELLFEVPPSCHKIGLTTAVMAAGLAAIDPTLVLPNDHYTSPVNDL